MSYTINRLLTDTSLDEADSRVREALKAKGFGVLTEIDVAATMQEKLDRQIDGYRILGACNPSMAYEALQVEPQVGAMLPCNVILREVQGGVDIGAIDPVASMSAIDNAQLTEVAGEVRDMLREVVESL
jgi:uncharacterized protein (DUF302 family)